MREYQERQARLPRRKGKVDGADLSADACTTLEKHFRIFFPTESTVLRSRGGKPVSTQLGPLLPALKPRPRLTRRLVHRLPVRYASRKSGGSRRLSPEE